MEQKEFYQLITIRWSSKKVRSSIIRQAWKLSKTPSRWPGTQDNIGTENIGESSSSHSIAGKN